MLERNGRAAEKDRHGENKTAATERRNAREEFRLLITLVSVRMGKVRNNERREHCAESPSVIG